MPKLAIAQVTWNAQDAIYQVQDKIAPGATISVMDVANAAWREWLGRVPSFAFQSKDGQRFTARKETRARGGTYWVAYRKIGGKLTHTYLGRSEDVSLARLEEVAHSFSERGSKPSARLPSKQQQKQPETSSEMEWQDQYLSTKFFVPVARHALVSRPRLFSLLDEGRQCPLTLISAPAGFGKTTLLSAWIQTLSASNFVVAWVSLDEADNDPACFWSYVLTALDRVRPGNYGELAAYTRAQSQPSLQSVTTACLNRLAEEPKPLILILDDYHLLTDEALHTSLTSFVEHLPPQVSVILSTRADPPLPLTRLRVRGQLLEVCADQLRTTPEEAMAFLREVMHLDLPEQELAEVEKRTEGWLVGLQLVGLSLQGLPSSTSSRDLLEEICGQQGYILDYLTEEVLSRQEPAVQRFLLNTSVLERLSAPLCDALLGRGDSQQVLEALQRANLFVVPLDSQRRWYRYHALFAEALRTRLEQDEGINVREVHLRASQWNAQHGSSNEAISHALFAGAWEFAADLIERTHFTLFSGQRVQDHIRLRAYLAQLPDMVVRSRPRLCLATAQILHSSAAPPTMLEPWLQAAEAILSTQRSAAKGALTEGSEHPGDEPTNLLGEITAFRAYLHSYQGDAETTLALCQMAWSLLSADNFAARCDVALAQAVAMGNTGEAAAAYLSAQEAARMAQAGGYTSYAIFYLSFAALFLIVCGRLHEAWQVLQQAVELSNKPAGIVLPTMCWVDTLQAEILREWNRLDEALEVVKRAIYLGEQLEEPAVLVLAYAILVRIAFSRGDMSAARIAVQQGENTVLKMYDVALRDYLRSHFTEIDQVRLLLVQGELESARRMVEGHGSGGSKVTLFASRSEEMVLLRLQIAQQQTAVALIQLVSLLDKATRQERWGHVIELLLLQSLAFQGKQQEDHALASLEKAVRLAEPEGYIRSFVDEGASMRTLLDKHRERQRKQGPTPYLDEVLAAFSPQTVTVQRGVRQALLAPLSERELEVLHLLAGGASNQEIAKKLVITLDTVKRHVSNVLSKLAVSNRTQAVMRARELGLLQEKALSAKPWQSPV